MHETFKEKLAGYGRWTYRGAWALEILAAAIGLATGLALGYQAFSNAGQDSITSIDFALASAPFIMVAIAELTKIPIATLLFSSTWYWKPIVFVFLLALAGITFETVFMGMERAATLRQLKYEDISNQIKARQYEVAQITSRIADVQASDVLQKRRTDLELVQQQGDQERNKIESLIKEVERELEGQKVILPGSARVRDSITEKLTQLNATIAERDKQLQVATGLFERQRDSFVDRIKSARSSGDIDTARRYEDELSKLINPRRRIELQFQSKVTSTEAEVAGLRVEFEKIQANSPPLTAAQRQLLNAKREELKRRLEQVDREWDERRAAALKLVEDAQGIEVSRQGGMQTEQKRKDEISAELSNLEATRIEFARTDQIRRIAARFYGRRPEAVTDDQAGFVSVLWFGSLALLAALAGPLTAIVALSLQRIGARDIEPKSKLSMLIRRMLLTWRWKRTRTVSVPFEVKVETPVDRIVEVPVEKVVKEILYVPVLTDDPEAIRRALSENLPKEVADLVSIKSRGSRVGAA